MTLKVQFWHFLIPWCYVNSQNTAISFDFSWFWPKTLLFRSKQVKNYMTQLTLILVRQESLKKDLISMLWIASLQYTDKCIFVHTIPQWAWLGVKLTRLMSIFTYKKVWNFFYKKSAEKSDPKKTRGWKVPCLMPIRVNDNKLLSRTMFCYLGSK